MIYSEIVGLPLEDALKQLYANNLQDIELKLTAPGQGLIPQGQPRVIRVLGDEKEPNAKMIITIAFENYVKGGVESGI